MCVCYASLCCCERACVCVCVLCSFFIFIFIWETSFARGHRLYFFYVTYVGRLVDVVYFSMIARGVGLSRTASSTETGTFVCVVCSSRREQNIPRTFQAGKPFGFVKLSYIIFFCFFYSLRKKYHTVGR